MTIEDDFIAELNDYEHRIAEAVRKQEEAQRQQAEERSLREEALRKEAEERRQKEEERRLKEEALRQQAEAVKLLLGLGVPAAEVAQKLGLELDYVAGLG